MIDSTALATERALVMAYPLSRQPRPSYYGFGQHFVTRPQEASDALIPVPLPSEGHFLNLAVSLGDQAELLFELLRVENQLGLSLLQDMKWRLSWDGADLYSHLEDCFERDESAWQALGQKRHSLCSDEAASAYLKKLGLEGLCRPSHPLRKGELEDVRPWRYTLF
jgi:hypothetical protein|tara:strand:+ start:1968 stop:2465 length:498 start_codon:yes stop_codon:yes gene_type:complete